MPKARNPDPIVSYIIDAVEKVLAEQLSLNEEEIETLGMTEEFRRGYVAALKEELKFLSHI